MTGPEIFDAAVDLLERRLPASWTVQKQTTGSGTGEDLVIKSPGSGGSVLVLVEIKTSVSPRDVEALIGGPWRRWRRQMGNQPLLLVSPYLSPRVRELLTEETVSYVDLTGNIRISVDYPGIYVETQGASQDPHAAKPRQTLRGAKAGAVVRVLTEAAPPYSATEIAKVAGVNEGYLSRILETLVDEGLVQRARSGVVGVDWPGMLRRRARGLDLFRPVGSHRYVARQGTAELIDRLRRRGVDGERPPTVTGSFAAARVAPVAAPSLLVVYTMDPRALADELDLLPADAGADTVLIRPENDVAFARARRDGGLAWAAVSQVAVDCLAGSGRMPAEGEALIDWMQRNEAAWRYDSIQALIDDNPAVEG